jgi:hypothetical protein
MGQSAFVSLSKKLNNFCRNEMILMKFSGPVQLHSGKFLSRGSWIRQPQGYDPGPKMACCEKIYFLPEFLYYRDVTYLFGNLRSRAKKNWEPNLEFWGRAQNNRV